jgi:predicted nuclease with TOPRIM domain
MATMTVRKLAPTLAGSVALASTVLAGATIWLILTDPGTVTSALAEGSAERFLRGLLEVIGSAVGRLLRWV